MRNILLGFAALPIVVGCGATVASHSGEGLYSLEKSIVISAGRSKLVALGRFEIIADPAQYDEDSARESHLVRTRFHIKRVLKGEWEPETIELALAGAYWGWFPDSSNTRDSGLAKISDIAEKNRQLQSRLEENAFQTIYRDYEQEIVDNRNELISVGMDTKLAFFIMPVTGLNRGLHDVYRRSEVVVLPHEEYVLFLMDGIVSEGLLVIGGTQVDIHPAVAENLLGQTE